VASVPSIVPEDGIGGCRLRSRRQVVDADDPCGRRHFERDGVSGWDRRFQVSGVDDAATYRDIVKLSGAHVSDLLTVTPATQLLVAGEQADPACPRQPRGCLGEMLADLAAGRAFVEPRVLPDLIDTVFAERQRVHAVVGGGGVQADERIRVRPMTPGGVLAIYHRHFHVRLSYERVGEGKAARTRPHNQIIGVEQHALVCDVGRDAGPQFVDVARVVAVEALPTTSMFRASDSFTSPSRRYTYDRSTLYGRTYRLSSERWPRSSTSNSHQRS
jgi:hypothetical protein